MIILQPYPATTAVTCWLFNQNLLRSRLPQLPNLSKSWAARLHCALYLKEMLSTHCFLRRQTSQTISISKRSMKDLIKNIELRQQEWKSKLHGSRKALGFQHASLDLRLLAMQPSQRIAPDQPHRFCYSTWSENTVLATNRLVTWQLWMFRKLHLNGHLQLPAEQLDSNSNHPRIQLYKLWVRNGANPEHNSDCQLLRSGNAREVEKTHTSLKSLLKHD